jgi:hypothetical protein
MTGHHGRQQRRESTMNRVQRQLTTISKLVLTATAAVAVTIAPPTIAHADPGTLFFQSPSGNIHCDLGRGMDGNAGVECEVENATYEVPPGPCQLRGPFASQFLLGQGDTRPDVGCVPTSNPPWQTLDYGQTRLLGPITCDSEPSGMTCTDSNTGHFFRVSRDSYQLG